MNTRRALTCKKTSRLRSRDRRQRALTLGHRLPGIDYPCGQPVLGRDPRLFAGVASGVLPASASGFNHHHERCHLATPARPDRLRRRALSGNHRRDKRYRCTCRGPVGQGDSEGSPGGKLLSPARRRQAVEHVRQKRDVSQRRACQVLCQPRSSQRYQAKKPPEEEKRLLRRMHELVRKYPRYGYRMIGAKLGQEGWRINAKRMYRLWRQEGFKVPKKTRKRRRLGHEGNSCVRRRAEHKDHVWTWDFLHDRTRRGTPLKWFAITDEYTRECLALEVDRSIPADRVLDILTHLFLTRGVCQATFAVTTVLSSSLRRSVATGRRWDWRCSTSNLAALGKTASRNRSSAAFAMSC